MALTITTWNLQGSQGVDVEKVAAYAREVGSDLLALQEIQRRQARAVARMLQAHSLRWGFKHWPMNRRPEGMALVGVTRPVRRVRTRAISRRWQLVNYKRRIVQLGLVADDQLGTLGIANLHLTPHRDNAAIRERELGGVLSRLDGASTGSWILTGDMNASPRSDLFEQMQTSGFTSVGGGPTNFRGGPADRSADLQLDYIWVAGSLIVHEVRLPKHGEPGFAGVWPLSDHLPLTARLVAAQR